jgi:hypothetical protein
MAIELSKLLDKAFFSAKPLRNATESIERARDRYLELKRTGATSFELVAPSTLDEAWVRERLLRPLVYYCESEGRPIPDCAGVFVSLFVGEALYCITVADVIAWARGQLGVTVDELRAQYGTHELETAQR